MMFSTLLPKKINGTKAESRKNGRQITPV